MILNHLSPVLCDRHRYADHIVSLPGTLLATLLRFPNLPSHSVRSAIVNALYPPENLGSPPKVHVRCKAASASANHVSCSAQIAAHHSLAAHAIERSYRTGMCQDCTLLPFFSHRIYASNRRQNHSEFWLNLLASVPLLFPREHVQGIFSNLGCLY